MDGRCTNIVLKLSTNIRLSLIKTNALAYLGGVSGTKRKKVSKSTPKAVFKPYFFFVIYEWAK